VKLVIEPASRTITTSANDGYVVTANVGNDYQLKSVTMTCCDNSWNSCSQFNNSNVSRYKVLTMTTY